MKTKILLNVDYSDDTGKFWCESYIKNKIINIDMDNMHNDIAEIIQDIDGHILSYNNKPQNDIFRDTKDGQSKQVGYVYRSKCDIYDDVKCKWVTAYFDAWVEIRKVVELKLKPVN